LISVTTGGHSIADSLSREKSQADQVIETKKEEQNVLAGNKTLQQI
jgi:hypothetical protein